MISVAFLACIGARGPIPGARTMQARGGVDDFSRNTLRAYQQRSDGGQHWKIAGGALTGTGPANQSVLLRRDARFADGWVEAVSSRADDGGLVVRARENGDYYLLAFRDDQAPDPRGAQNLALYHHVGSEYREMWHRDVAWPRGSRHTIRLEADGPWLHVYWDGELSGELQADARVNDPTPYTGPGLAGVRHYGASDDWITRFETFRWSGARPASAGGLVPSDGTVLLHDGFDRDNDGRVEVMYDRFENWTVEDGSVDLIGRGERWDFLPGHGLYVDLDGGLPPGAPPTDRRTDAGALLSRREFRLAPGVYELRYLLAGSQRGDLNTVIVSLGDLFRTEYQVAADTPFHTVKHRIRVGRATRARIRFENLGADRSGVLLDDVELVRLRR